ncbi:LysE/ArgO family amino acid transporter [Desmospora activa]|uniref:L-lysine exporter family protein LysE/ArgO n=1 Tax=Desmospora activa DSM 45169 TaxID=1121389 RepID=A0A2T4ZBB9_9BACL|nr:LysE/ArgO family amino acid transporter [Desmospora activa]PTM59189.1 L-lysine exporter family protein LysE/ArgO [Desmospora activa DSM 45169]
MLEATIHGVILAFGLILPLGAQNVFIFNQGANQATVWRALPALLTASLCDTLLILLAVLGISLLVLSFAWLQMTIFGIGFLFLLYMGWSVWNSTPATDETAATPLSPQKQIGFAASVSLLNPHAILDTVGVIGTSSLHYDGMEKGAFTLACIIVSWLWFLGLILAGRWLKKRDRSGRWLRRLNRVSALIIWGVAVYIGWSLLQQING